MIKLHRQGLMVLLIVSLVCRINAQFSSSAEILILDGTSTNWNGDFFVGFDDLTRNVTLIATNGASLCVTNGSSFLGYSLNSNSNVAFIVGNGTGWTNSKGMFVGEGGAYNRVSLADGARLFSENGRIGSGSSARMNAVAVTGPNSVWSNSATLTVGDKGMFNRLDVVESGTVFSAEGTIGASGKSNSVYVAGADSAWHCQDILFVGYRAQDNRLTIADNGTVSCTTLYVGDYNCSYNLLTITNGGRLFCDNGDIGRYNATGNNAIWITGAGSVLSNANKFSMGSADKRACQLTIDRGGAMYSKNGDVAAGTAWVSDADSIWENDGYLYVRSPGLVVTNGGRVKSVFVRVASGDKRSQLSVLDGGIVQSSTYGQIGYGYAAQSNTGLVSGAGSLWTNGTSLAVGDYGQSNESGRYK